MDLLSRFKGSMIGMAVGDALGACVEMKQPGTFEYVSEMRDGSCFGFPKGYWTDDTSMALCLAESLLRKGKIDTHDQLELYVKWMNEGYLSSIPGRTNDVGNTVRSALKYYIANKKSIVADEKPATEYRPGNGSLMRLAPVPLFFHGLPLDIILPLSGLSSVSTHLHPEAIHSCIFYGYLIELALQEHPKQYILDRARLNEVEAFYDLDELVKKVGEGSYKKIEPNIVAAGTAGKAMEAALWAFYTTDDFRSGCEKTANLGHDSDTVAAIYGMLAGSYYGVDAIPRTWLSDLVDLDLIENYAVRLYEANMKNRSLKPLTEG